MHDVGLSGVGRRAAAGVVGCGRMSRLPGVRPAIVGPFPAVQPGRPVAFGAVLFAHPGAGAVTLALVLGPCGPGLWCPLDRDGRPAAPGHAGLTRSWQRCGLS